MPTSFLHGVEVVEIDTGTAPDADAARWPLNTPVLVAGRRSEAASLGGTGTLAAAIDDIFDQAGAMVVVIRVTHDDGEGALTSNIIGGIDDETGAYQGLQAFLAAENVVGVAPRILVAPEFSQIPAVIADMVPIAARLRGIIMADGPNTTDAEALTHRETLGSDRIYLVDPWVKVWDTVGNAEAIRPASARVAGVIAKSDAERGFWWSRRRHHRYHGPPGRFRQVAGLNNAEIAALATAFRTAAPSSEVAATAMRDFTSTLVARRSPSANPI